MGVPKFYRWVSERYPCLSEVVKENQIPEFDNLYLDMNGIIHSCSHPNDDDPHFRISEAKIFEDIFHYLEFLFRIIRPQRTFFMAVDGVAPRAKMNQQRGRRFMSAINALLAAEEAKKKGEVLPSEDRFDSNCITPGTEFMVKLHEQLQYFIKMKISTDDSWRDVKVYLSGHDVPGEGEHKIMDFIRYERSQPGYDQNTRHCLYGLDADLVILGLSSHEPHFSLLREEVKFIKPKKNKSAKTINPEETTFHLLHLSLFREYIDFQFYDLKNKLSFPYNVDNIIDDWVLMGFLVGNDFIPHLPHLHIHEAALPIVYEAYKKIMPSLDGYLNEGGKLNLPRFEKFLQILSQFDRDHFGEEYDDMNYMEGKTFADIMADKMRDIRTITVPGSKKRTKKTENSTKPKATSSNKEMLTEKATNDLKKLLADQKDMYGDISSPSSDDDTAFEVFGDENSFRALGKDAAKAINNIAQNDDLEPIIEEKALDRFYDVNDLSDEDDWSPAMEASFVNHKRMYYEKKLAYEKVTQDVLREQAIGYITAIQWNLHYYYDGCVSWSWYYRHHYSPYLSDVTDFADLKIELDLGEPFLPFQQLLAVLPAQSRNLLPKAYQNLMIDDESPIIDYYPTTFHTDLNGKKQDWEAVVLIPFIEEKRLLSAMMPNNQMLNEDEKKRNGYGNNLLFKYKPLSETSSGTSKRKTKPLRSTLPEVFSDLENDLSECQRYDRSCFYLPKGKIIKGLLPNVRLDVYFMGFPTFKHLPLTCELRRVDVKVFQSNSKNDSIVLSIGLRPEMDCIHNAEKLADRLIGREVHVNWPYLYPAFVCSMVTRNTVFSKDQEKRLRTKNADIDHFERNENNIRLRYFTTRAVEMGGIDAIVYVRLLVGTRQTVDKEGNVKLEREWAEMTTPYALNTVVESSSMKKGADNHKLKTVPRTLFDMFPVDSLVFIAASNYYGCSGRVCSGQDQLDVYKLRIRLETLPEPCMQFVLDQSKLASNKSKSSSKKPMLLVHARSLFRPQQVTGNVIPDKMVTFQQWDRVVNVRHGIAVPLGVRGTIVNIHYGSQNMSSYNSRQKGPYDFKLDVLFDEEFFGGKVWKGERRSGYRMQPSAVLNLSHGWRMAMQDRPSEARNAEAYCNSLQNNSTNEVSLVNEPKLCNFVNELANASLTTATKQQQPAVIPSSSSEQRSRDQTLTTKNSAFPGDSGTNETGRSGAKNFGQMKQLTKSCEHSQNFDRTAKKYAQPMCYLPPSANNVLDALTKNPLAVFDKNNEPTSSSLHVTVEKLMFGSHDANSMKDRIRFNEELKRKNLQEQSCVTAMKDNFGKNDTFSHSLEPKTEKSAGIVPKKVAKENDESTAMRNERVETFFAQVNGKQKMPKLSKKMSFSNDVDEQTRNLRNLLNIGSSDANNTTHHQNLMQNYSHPPPMFENVNYGNMAQQQQLANQFSMLNQPASFGPFFGGQQRNHGMFAPAHDFAQATNPVQFGGNCSAFRSPMMTSPHLNMPPMMTTSNFPVMQGHAPPMPGHAHQIPSHSYSIPSSHAPFPNNLPISSFGGATGVIPPPIPAPFDFEAMRRFVLQDQNNALLNCQQQSTNINLPPTNYQQQAPPPQSVLSNFGQPLNCGKHVGYYDTTGLFVPMQVLKNQRAPAYVQSKMANRSPGGVQKPTETTGAITRHDAVMTSSSASNTQMHESVVVPPPILISAPSMTNQRSRSRLAINFGQ